MRYHESRCNIGDFARIQSGFAFSSNDWSDDGYPVIKINNVRNGKVSFDSCSYVSEPLPEGAERHRLARGDLLITLTGEIGAIGIVDQDFPMYLNQRVGRIQITDQSKATLRFLALLLSEPSVRKEMSSNAKGNAQLNISPKSIEDLSVPLPPLETQRRIVDLVSSVDAYIDTLQQQADVAREARRAVLHELLSTGGDDWSESAISEFAEVFSGFAFKSELFSDSEGIPLIRIRDLQKRNSTEVGYKGEYEEHYVVNHGDFLIGMDGEFRCYEWLGPKALLNQRVCRIQSFELSKIVPRFVYLLLNQYLKEIEDLTSFTTVKHISVKTIRDIRLPMPPLQEQRRIAGIVSSMDEVIQSAEQAVSDAKSLRSGLLSDLLSGEHEIPESYDKFFGAA